MPANLVVPRHIGFILDGNRRFAKLRGLRPWRGHEFGRDTVHRLLDWCLEFGVKELTLYTFSLQNFSRPQMEVTKLMSMLEKELKVLAKDKRVHEHRVRIQVIGEVERLPEHVQKAIREVEAATAEYDDFVLNACIAYGGKEEIFSAVKTLMKQVANKVIDVADVTLETFESHLFLKSQPDMIIRTGGDNRTSNFLPWQSTYSEWFFVKKLLPEFEREDFHKILEEYSSRERRFGK
jgi:tritrans,polycis-undecaprenyl-diphosphate synthase [geranylgeranyl-diphosphate specific]